MTSKEALKDLRHGIQALFITMPNVYDDTKIIEKDLEVLEQFEILKNYYEPFKQFLKEMFEKGYNDDLTKVKEWLNEN